MILGIAAAITAITAIPAVSLAVMIPARLSGILFGALLLAIAAQLTVRAIRDGRAREPERTGLPAAIHEAIGGES